MIDEIKAIHELQNAPNWEDRNEFYDLINWWKKNKFGGVCGLYGIGGSGKTAIVERFFQIINGSINNFALIQKSKVSKVLIHSFYIQSDAEVFLNKFNSWLPDVDKEFKIIPKAEQKKGFRDDSGSDNESVLERIDRKLSFGADILLILDGFEMAQYESYKEEPFGQIKNPSLKRFIIKVANGYYKGVYIVLTSRFQLYDLLVHKCSLFQEIKIGRLNESTALNLFLKKEVSINKKIKILEIINELDFHAFSVELAATYIKEFCNSNPEQFNTLDDIDKKDVNENSLNPEHRRLAILNERFNRLSERYFETLSEKNVSAWFTLQRLCLYRPGINFSSFKNIYNNYEKSKDFIQDVEFLKRLSLIDFQSDKFIIHPLIREGVVRKFNKIEKSKEHGDIARILSTKLNSSPGNIISDNNVNALNELEEMIFHTYQSGEIDEAFELYINRLGGYSNLSKKQVKKGLERGKRICEFFITIEDDKIHVSNYGWERTLYDWSRYNEKLGFVDLAYLGYSKILNSHNYRYGTSHAKSSEIQISISDILIGKGCPGSSKIYLEKTPNLYVWARNSKDYKEFLIRTAYIEMLFSNYLESINNIKKAWHWDMYEMDLQETTTSYYHEMIFKYRELGLLKNEKAFSKIKSTAIPEIFYNSKISFYNLVLSLDEIDEVKLKEKIRSPTEFSTYLYLKYLECILGYNKFLSNIKKKEVTNSKSIIGDTYYMATEMASLCEQKGYFFLLIKFLIVQIHLSLFLKKIDEGLAKIDKCFYLLIHGFKENANIKDPYCYRDHTSRNFFEESQIHFLKAKFLVLKSEMEANATKNVDMENVNLEIKKSKNLISNHFQKSTKEIDELINSISIEHFINTDLMRIKTLNTTDSISA